MVKKKGEEKKGEERWRKKNGGRKMGEEKWDISSIYQ